MLSEPVTVETSETEFPRRLGSAVQLRALEKSQTIKVPKLYQGGSLQLRMIDLNLFRLFDAMMLHRSVRKASQILSVTPSAVSHALSRLRQSIGDELFVPTESGMEPTQRALELASAVREGLSKLELALTGKQPVPPEALRTLRIWATDYPSMVILPSLVKRLAKSAPNVDLRVFSSNRVDCIRHLEKGRADLVIGSFTELPAGLRRSKLFRGGDVIIVRTRHPLTPGGITTDPRLGFLHLLLERSGAIAHVNRQFSDQQAKSKRVS